MAEPIGFRTATDQATSRAGITLRRVARAFGIEPESLSRWRRERPENVPPADWRATLAHLVAEGATEHRAEADRLDALAARLRKEPP